MNSRHCEVVLQRVLSPDGWCLSCERIRRSEREDHEVSHVDSIDISLV